MRVVFRQSYGNVRVRAVSGQLLSADAASNAPSSKIRDLNMKVAIILSTIDRYDLTVKCIGDAVATADYPFELFCCDNGSSDRRVIDYIASLHPVYHRLNEKNEGCAQMHNQMMLRSDADLFVLLDNDIEIRRASWLKTLVECYAAIPESGVIGIHSVGLAHDPYPAVIKNDKLIHPYIDVFGTRMFSKEVVAKVGYFCEDYGLYGLVDNEYNCRVQYMGFLNYYIGGPSGFHHGNDVGDGSGYRKMKDDSLRTALPVYGANMQRYAENKGTKECYIPPPAIR